MLLPGEVEAVRAEQLVDVPVFFAGPADDGAALAVLDDDGARRDGRRGRGRRRAVLRCDAGRRGARVGGQRGEVDRQGAPVLEREGARRPSPPAVRADGVVRRPRRLGAGDDERAAVAVDVATGPGLSGAVRRGAAGAVAAAQGEGVLGDGGLRVRRGGLRVQLVDVTAAGAGGPGRQVGVSAIGGDDAPGIVEQRAAGTFLAQDPERVRAPPVDAGFVSPVLVLRVEAVAGG